MVMSVMERMGIVNWGVGDEDCEGAVGAVEGVG